MGQLIDKLTGVMAVGQAIVRNPSEIRAIPEWLQSLRSSDGAIGAELPWLAYGAIEFLCEYLDDSKSVYGFGSGGSTIWLAGRSKTVTSVEHDRDWFEVVRSR